MSESQEKFVRWSVFIWAVSIVSILIVGIWSITITLMGTISELKQDIATIKTDVSWIKQSLLKDELSFKK